MIFLRDYIEINLLTKVDFKLYDEQTEKIVASCACGGWHEQGGWLEWVHVDPLHRRQGHGELLLTRVLEEARTAGKTGLGLSVRKTNKAAIALYEKLGFVACYEIGEDVIMTAHLSPKRRKGLFLTAKQLEEVGPKHNEKLRATYIGRALSGGYVPGQAYTIRFTEGMICAHALRSEELPGETPEYAGWAEIHQDWDMGGQHGYLFQFDFDLVATAARSTRGKKPVLAVAELAKAKLPGNYLQQDIVRFHAYEGHGELRLPLDQRPVREWLKKQVFTEMPCIQLGSTKGIPVGTLLEPETQQHQVCLSDTAVDGLLRHNRCIIFRRVESEIPPYQPGDVLLVRESTGHKDGQVLYRADQVDPYKMGIYWCRNYQMPMAHCRLQLTVVQVHRDLDTDWGIEVVPELKEAPV